MSERKQELLAEIYAAMVRLPELFLEAKSLGITNDEYERVLGPLKAKFEELFDD